jgi:hypothetical protein
MEGFKMTIKKFINGKIKMSVQKQYDINPDGTIDENIYHNDMFFSDLSINQINGYQYIVDYNTQLVYEMGSYLLQNPLKFILDTLQENGKMYLYPLTKKESLSLIQDLENGY